MTKYLVITADRGRASIYLLDDRYHPSETKPPHLVEQASLVNPAVRLPQSELFANTRPGLRQGAAGDAPHAVDDHRDESQEGGRRTDGAFGGQTGAEHPCRL